MKLRQALILTLCFFLSSCSDNSGLRLGVSTTLEGSGLLTELVTAFEKEHQLSIKPIIAGSGQIHELVERGDIDTAITHDPEGEKKLLTENHISKRTPLMQNDFLIVGPSNDPAHIKLSLTPDEAFKKIVNAQALFISRSDQSGTHQMEQYWWKQAKISPSDEYYLKTGAGMGSTLTIAIERNAYTLVDRGTWIKFANKQGLVILFEDIDLLLNQYSLLSLNSTPEASPKSKNIALWEDWLTEGAGRKIIADYRINNQIIFSNTQ